MAELRIDVVVACPASFGVRPVVAAARAGGLGVIDAVGETDAAVLTALTELGEYAVGAQGRVGLRIATDQIAKLTGWAGALPGAPHLVLAWQGETETTIADILADPAVACAHIMVEVPSVAMALAVPLPDGSTMSFVAVAAEAGGFIGDTSGFILTQEIARLRARDPGRRWYLKGAVGPSVARACRLAGLDGVMVSDEILAFPETRMPAAQSRIVASGGMPDFSVIGETGPRPFRTLLRPACKAARILAAEAEATPDEVSDRLRVMTGWGDPEERIWPVGQGAALSPPLARRYRTIGRLVTALSGAAGEDDALAAAATASLSRESALARKLGVDMPVVQGPMTRVSDAPAFVAAVAKAGAAGTLALALMDGETTARRVADLRDLSDGRPFGVGILGYSGDALFDAQLAALHGTAARFAVLAGGRPDQWRRITELGLTCFLHAPAPQLVRMFLDQGVTGIVLEGRECGGHVGPCHSFPLWEAVLLDLSDRPAGAELQVLFAGGINDALSAAMVAAMAAEATQAGHAIGLLCGTAYLATDEAIETGAIQPGFQKEVLAGDRTALVVSGLGHANRCIRSPFVEDFEAERATLLARRASGDEMREVLDRMLLGRLRVASKGLTRDGDGLRPCPEDEQHSDGMFMAGEAVRLISARRSMSDLHQALTQEAADLIGARTRIAPATASNPRDVAVIGLQVVLPGAGDADAYWATILQGRSVISELPEGRWDHRRIYNPERAVGDVTNSKWGGFTPQILFDPTRYGIPPNSVQSIAVAQLMTLELAQRALDDAGYGTGRYDRSRASIVVAAADAGGFQGNELTCRSLLPFVTSDAGVADRLTPWREESFAAMITSVVAGRVANRLNFGGANFTIDAACASGLTAVALAADELTCGRADIVVTAAVDCSQTPFQFMAFANTGALSPTGAVRAFDRGADGTVISEGAVALVLKRLSDAERDGDRIYGVIRGAANSSDGRVAGLTAPNSGGQRLAMRRALDEAGRSAASIQMYEAHGTGTPVGDGTEFRTVSALLEEAGGRPDSCALGSVKSLIGHTKTAAGLASLAKVLLSLHHRVLPPHPVEAPIDGLDAPGEALMTLDRPRPWVVPPGTSRRAGISAFGFGGTNCHVVVEGYDGGLDPTPRGAAQWPRELFVFGADDAGGVLAQFDRLQAVLDGHDLRLCDVAAAQVSQARPGPAAAAFTAADADEVCRHMAALRAHLQEDAPLPGAVTLTRDRPERPPSLALLFPGQGVQRPGLGRDACLYLPEVGELLERSDAAFSDDLPLNLTEALYPAAAYDDDTRVLQAAALTDSRMAQIAIGTLSLGMARFLGGLGLEPAMAGGHSFGELTALAASGVLAGDDFLRLAMLRGRNMYEADRGEGGMCVVDTDHETAAALLSGLDGVVVANDNAPDQIVISGGAGPLEEAAERFRAAGHTVQRLPVGGAFHSPLMERASRTLAGALGDLPVGTARYPVHANRDGCPIDPAAGPMADRIAAHLLEPVAFREMVSRMRAAGAELFVDVGPGQQMAGLLRRNLPPECPVIAIDGTALSTVLNGVGALWLAGVPLALARLFDGRRITPLDLDALAARPFEPTATTFYIDGFKAMPARQIPALLPQRNLLTEEEVEDMARHRPETQTPEVSVAAPIAMSVPDPSLDRRPGVVTNDALAAYSEYQQTMRQFLAAQEQVMQLYLGAPHRPGPTLSEVAPPEQATLAGPDPAALPAPSADVVPLVSLAPSGSPAAAPQALTRDDLTALIVDAAVAVTGYPADMLDLDQDVEAELGIDSIKRLELLERVSERLPDGWGATMHDAAAGVTRLRSLRGWVDALVELLAEAGGGGDGPAPLPAAAPAPNATPAATPVAGDEALGEVTVLASRQPSADKAPVHDLPHPRRAEHPADPALLDDPSPCPTFVMKARPSGVPMVPRDWLSGLHLLAQGDHGLTEYVRSALRARGATVVLIPTSTLASPDAIRDAVADAVERHGPVRGLVHLSAARTRPVDWNSSDWPARARVEAKSLFTLVQASLPGLLQTVQGRAGRVLAASAFGGQFARDLPTHIEGCALGGAHQGLLKSLALEFEQLMLKAVDLDPEMDPGDLALQLIDEYVIWGGRQEIGYPRGQRTVFDLEEVLLADGAPTLPDNAVIVASGGGTGITAAILKRLVRKGDRVAILARSPRDASSDPELDACATPDEMRATLIARGRAQGFGPAEVESRLASAMRRRELADTLAALDACGVSTRYLEIDVRDGEAVAAGLAGLREETGRIDVLLHGAGVIEDCLFADKRDASLDRVFDTKVLGALNLLAAVDIAELNAIGFFSSIAGRFGNRGQADYAAANEILTRLSLQLKAGRPDLSVVAYNWGPWTGAGMADGTVNQQFLARGIVPIQVEPGTTVALRALADAPSAEMIAGQGDWRVGEVDEQWFFAGAQLDRAN